MKKDELKKQTENTTMTTEEMSPEELELINGGFEVKSSQLVTDRAVDDIIQICTSHC